MRALNFWNRHPTQGVWLVAILSIAIGVATATWSIAYGVWLRPLPFFQPNRLVSVGWFFEDAPVAVISHKLWQTAFGGDPATGTEIQLASSQGRITATIVGVLPPDRAPQFRGWATDCVIAMADGPAAGEVSTRRAYPRSLLGRLTGGSTLANAEAGLTAVLRTIDREHPVSGELPRTPSERGAASWSVHAQMEREMELDRRFR